MLSGVGLIERKLGVVKPQHRINLCSYLQPERGMLVGRDCLVWIHVIIVIKGWRQNHVTQNRLK